MSEQPKRTTESRAARVPEQGRRATVTFRCLPDLQAKLREASAASSRSASEEIERRLEASFHDDDAMRVIRETIRQEMRAEFAGRREAALPIFQTNCGQQLSFQPYNVARANDYPDANLTLLNWPEKA